PARIYSNNRIGGAVEIRTSPVDMQRKSLLLESEPLSIQRLLGNKSEKRAQPRRAREQLAGQDPLEFQANLGVRTNVGLAAARLPSHGAFSPPAWLFYLAPDRNTR